MKILGFVAIAAVALAGAVVALNRHGETANAFAQAPDGNPGLLFHTGFEPGTAIVGTHLTGLDQSLSSKSDWTSDLRAFAQPASINLGQAQAGETAAEIAPGPTDPSNHALLLTLRSPTQQGNEVKARSQVELYGIHPGLRDFTFSTDVYIDPAEEILADSPRGIDWLTIAEFWNNEFWGKDASTGFRVTVGLGKAAGHDPLHFILTADTADRNLIWSRGDPRVPVPLGTWFRIDYTFREGDHATGRFVLAITPRGGKRQVVYDVTDYTQSPVDPAPDGLTGFNPFKAYTSKQVMQYLAEHGTPFRIWFDNAELVRRS
jgi:hypothetical protein